MGGLDQTELEAQPTKVDSRPFFGEFIMRLRLIKYEKEFVEQCRKLKITTTPDEDGTPIVRAKGKRLKKQLIMTPFQKGKFGIIILTTSTKTKNKFLKKIASLKVQSEVYVEGDTEAIVLVKNEEMEKVVRPMKFTRSRVLTPEQRNEIRERLQKARAARKAG